MNRAMDFNLILDDVSIVCGGGRGQEKIPINLFISDGFILQSRIHGGD